MRKNIFYFDSSDANRLIDFLLYKFNKKFPELEIENFRYKLHHELMEYVHAESRKIPEELLERFPHEWRRELDFMLDQMKTIQAKLIGSISSNVDSKLESHQKNVGDC